MAGKCDASDAALENHLTDCIVGHMMVGDDEACSHA